MFRARPVYESNTRCEKNRVLLADAKEPPKSIFNIGQLRHNVMSHDESQKLFATYKNFS